MRRQHGVVSRRQLLALGYSREAIEHRRRSGRLHPVHRGVYAVGRRELPQEGRWMAAVLACGDGAVLSHRSAAALWGVGKEKIWERTAQAERRLIEVSVTRRSAPRHRGIATRMRPSLPGRDLRTLERIPLTAVVRTLLDYATLEAANRLQRAVNEADKHDLIDPEALRRAIEGYAGEPGVRPLREVLDRDTFLLSDGELELLFHPLAGEAGASSCTPPPASRPCASPTSR